MGIRDGSFSHFLTRKMGTGNQGRFLFPLFFEKWEKEPSLIPSFSPSSEKWEKEPSLIPIFSPHQASSSKNRSRKTSRFSSEWV